MPDIQYYLRISIALGTIVLGSNTFSSPALAGPNCSNFFSNSDGSWSPTSQIMLAGPTSQTMVGPSDRFRAGAPGLSGRIGRYLDARCRPSRSAVGPRAIPRMP